MSREPAAAGGFEPGGEPGAFEPGAFEPGGFLAEMAACSGARVAAARCREGEAGLRRRARETPPAPGLRLDGFDVIAEVKRRTPAGRRLAAVPARVAARARAYAAAGAAAVSVLSEPTRFGGALAHVAAAARAASVPVLRKDFLVDPYQVFEARAAGAGGVLLIAKILDDRRLAEMLDAADEARLFVVLEAFDEQDAARLRDAAALSLSVPLLCGVNARDLARLGTDRARHACYVGELPAGVPRVAESGLETPEDAAAVAALGYELALVGTAAMLADDPAALVAAMIAAGRDARRACASA